jgi:hypothetical protein
MRLMKDSRPGLRNSNPAHRYIPYDPSLRGRFAGTLLNVDISGQAQRVKSPKQGRNDRFLKSGCCFPLKCCFCVSKKGESEAEMTSVDLILDPTRATELPKVCSGDRALDRC